MFYAVFALILLSFNLVKMDYDLEDFVKLYPLEGEWTMPFKGGELIEKWEKKYNKMLEGETIFLKGDEEQQQESVSLFLRDGRIYYTPVVEGNEIEPVPFTLINIDKNKFIFQNKEHDFPQRIIYELKSGNELIATIEGETDKGFKKIVYRYKRKMDGS
ncbi:MAG: DUF6265 family protein [Bacteroidota bacterium]|nr:DUF6265 family protein [Bacteroidota bacterium]